MLRDLAEQPEGCGRFRLGEHVDLKIEVRAAVRQPGHAVLAIEDGDSDEDRLKRHDHREQVERVRIERLDSPDIASIHRDPRGKPDHMERGEPRPAGDGAQHIPHSVGH
jgi:hypothetical protein